MQKALLRKWILISVAFIAASSLVLVAASRLGEGAQANTSQNPSTADSIGIGTATNTLNSDGGGGTTQGDSGSRISRSSSDERDHGEHEDEENEAAEHSDGGHSH